MKHFPYSLPYFAFWLWFQEWPEEDYPPYANGPGYILSYDVAHFIVNEFEKHKLRVSSKFAFSALSLSLSLSHSCVCAHTHLNKVKSRSYLGMTN